MGATPRFLIHIVDEQTLIRIKKKQLVQTARRVMKGEKALRCEITVLITDDKMIQRLNSKYLGKSSTTDVIAFNTEEPKTNKNCGVGCYLGDVAISTGTAVRQAKIFKTTTDKEIELYMVHGILHLLGYRDKTKAQRDRMNRLQEEYTGGKRG